MLKLKKTIWIMILSIFNCCSNNPEKQKSYNMKMDIEIIPEDSKGGYSISWNDTLRSDFAKDDRYLEKRPYELYCYILNRKNDTLGYYIGCSSPRQWTYFQTSDNIDSMIYLKYSIGVNYFSSFLAEQSKEYIDNFNKRKIWEIKFKQIILNINSALRTKKKIELIQEKN